MNEKIEELNGNWQKKGKRKKSTYSPPPPHIGANYQSRQSTLILENELAHTCLKRNERKRIGRR